MNVGEVISALALCASDFDNDHLLMLKGVYSIEVKNDHIEVYFTDGNTTNIKVFPNGKMEYLGP